LGIGNGLSENTEPYGLPDTKRVARLEEALQIIRGLWDSNGEPFNYEGRFWTLRDAVFDLPLYAGKPPRIFIGAHFPRMLRLCGRYADGWLPGQKTSGAEYAQRLGVIREAAREANRSLQGFLACQTLLIAFGTSKEAVLEKALKNKYVAYLTVGLPGVVWEEYGLEHPLGKTFTGFMELVPSRVDANTIDVALERMTPELIDRFLYMGTPREILAEAAPLAAAGCQHFIIANMGSAFMGAGLSEFLRMAALMRALKRLEPAKER
jgi:phthiodiolone/phenolphthiodiolone dimycocerosates ketoreductase